MAQQDIVVIGFSGNARDALDSLSAGHNVVAFVDDNPALAGTSYCGIAIRRTADIAQFPQAGVLCLIGSVRSHRNRLGLIARFGIAADRFVTVVAPQASVSSAARIGRGGLILPGTVVLGNPEIGDHVMILASSVIHHDAVIGDGTVIGSRVVVAGGVRVGRECYIGSGATLMNDITLGDGCLVGMGSNVLGDVPAGAVVAGNPARVIRTV